MASKINIALVTLTVTLFTSYTNGAFVLSLPTDAHQTNHSSLSQPQDSIIELMVHNQSNCFQIMHAMNPIHTLPVQLISSPYNDAYLNTLHLASLEVIHQQSQNQTVLKAIRFANAY